MALSETPRGWGIRGILVGVLIGGLVAWLLLDGTAEAPAPPGVVSAAETQHDALPIAPVHAATEAERDRVPVPGDPAVGPGDPPNAAVTEAPSNTVHWTIRARCVDEIGQPLPGVTCTVLQFSQFEPKTSGADGRVDWNAALLRWEADRDWVVMTFAVEGRVPIERRVSSDAHVFDAGDVELPLAGSIRGRVTDEQGEPIHGAVVVPIQPLAADQQLDALMRYYGRGAKRLRPDVMLSCRSAEDGSFELAGVPHGPCLLMGRVDGRERAFAPAMVGPNGQVGTPLLVIPDLRPETLITGAVVVPEGNRMQSFVVTVSTEEGRAGTQHVARLRTNRHTGAFSVVVEPGRSYRLVVQPEPRSGLDAVVVEGVRPGLGAIELKLEARVPVDIFVAAPDGSPVQRARVQVTGADRRGMLVEVEHLADGHLRVYLPASLPVTLGVGMPGAQFHRIESVIGSTVGPVHVRLRAK